MNYPTPGRTVLYVLKSNGAIRPGVVIEAIEDRACLDLSLKPTDLSHTSPYQPLVPYDDDKKPGTWHWPPRA
ncbi:MAG TPA: hypothetical protein VK961_06975 [Chthoniobacter sp.]|nr:hypothetical protein [Chthoniobacter sp.]